MQLTKVYLVLLVFFGMQLSTYAQTENVLSLKAAQDLAVANNYQVKNALLDIQKAKKKIWETTAMGLPQVTASGQYQNMLDIPVSLVPAKMFNPAAEEGTFMELQFGTQHNANFGMSASQLVFSGPYIVGLRAAKVFLQLSEQAAEKSESDIRMNVAQTYSLVLMAESNKHILTQSMDNMKELLYQTKEMNKLGFTEELNVDQLQFSLTQLENTVRAFDRQIATAKRLLNFQMGAEVETPLQLSDQLEELVNNISYESLINTEFKPEIHIQYRMVETQEKASRLSLAREKTEYLPNISLFGSYQKNAMRNEFNIFDASEKWYPTTVVGLNIQMPIFSSGMRMAKVNQAKLELEKTTNLKEQTRQGLLLEVSRARMDMKNALDKYQTEKKNLDLATKILTTMEIKYKEGLASSFELTQSQNQYLSTQANYLTAMYELLNAKNKLDQVLSNY